MNVNQISVLYVIETKEAEISLQHAGERTEGIGSDVILGDVNGVHQLSRGVE